MIWQNTAGLIQKVTVKNYFPTSFWASSVRRGEEAKPKRCCTAEFNFLGNAFIFHPLGQEAKKIKAFEFCYTEVNCFFSLPEFIPQCGRMRQRKRSSLIRYPYTSQFLSSDPFVTNPALSQDYNRYSYVRNNPLKFTDPSGYMVGGDDPIPCPTFGKKGDRWIAFMNHIGDFFSGFIDLFSWGIGFEMGEGTGINDNYCGAGFGLGLQSYGGPMGNPSATSTGVGGAAMPVQGVAEPTVFDLLKIFHPSYLEFRSQYHNKNVVSLYFMNTEEIAMFLYGNIILEPDLNNFPECDGQHAIVNYITVHPLSVNESGQLIDKNESFLIGNLIDPEYNPYFSYAVNGRIDESLYYYDPFEYPPIVVYTNNGIFGFQIQWRILQYF